MCVVALALKQHPDWPIILIGNRDELHDRAAEPLHIWDDESGILAGRDLLGGGTWLGVQPARGAIAVVTNVRGDPPSPAKRSRGALVRDVLTDSRGDAARVVDPLDDYNGFSLLAVDAGGARLVTNRPAPILRTLPAGVHALANDPWAQPCARARRLAEALQQWSRSPALPTALLDLLTDTAHPALFLRHPVYGTRCSTLVAVGGNGAGTIIERQYDKGGNPVGETALGFTFSEHSLR